MQKIFRAKYISLIAVLLGFAAAPKALAAVDYIDIPQTTSTTITLAQLDSIRTSLEGCVTGALAADQLTEIQADMLRAKLCLNQKQESSFLSDNKLEIAEGQEIMRGLGGIEDVMQASMRATISANSAEHDVALMAVTPANTGSIVNSRVYQYGYAERPFTGGPDLAGNMARYNNAEIDLSARLEDGRADGFITASEYFQLKGKLNDLVTRTQRNSDLRRNFTWKEQAKLDKKLADFQQDLNDEMSDKQIASAY